MFYAPKWWFPSCLRLRPLVTGLGDTAPLLVYALALGLRFLIPDFWLGNRIKNRQKKIRLGLPDVLDLLIICIEAGLSLDQATSRTAEELRKAQPELCDELRWWYSNNAPVALAETAGETWRTAPAWTACATLSRC